MGGAGRSARLSFVPDTWAGARVFRLLAVSARSAWARRFRCPFLCGLDGLRIRFNFDAFGFGFGLRLRQASTPCRRLFVRCFARVGAVGRLLGWELPRL